MVEKWLVQVESAMIDSIRQVCGDAYEAYGNSKRNRWVLEWPGQVVLCVGSIFWTLEVTDAMKTPDGMDVGDFFKT